MFSKAMKKPGRQMVCMYGLNLQRNLFSFTCISNQTSDIAEQFHNYKENKLMVKNKCITHRAGIYRKSFFHFLLKWHYYKKRWKYDKKVCHASYIGTFICIIHSFIQLSFYKLLFKIFCLFLLSSFFLHFRNINIISIVYLYIEFCFPNCSKWVLYCLENVLSSACVCVVLLWWCQWGTLL